jgi:hypothetical protein
VSKLQATDQLRVAEWPHQVLGQNVWLRYDGFDMNGAPVYFDDRTGEPHGTLPGLGRPVPLDWLKTLKDGSALTISFRVNFEGVADNATAVSFPSRGYIVKSAVLIIDPSDMILDGFAVHADVTWTFSGLDAPNNTATRIPTGGPPPYTYTSDNPTIASVMDGKVVGTGNGRTTIRITDNSGITANFQVQVSNVYRLIVSPKKMNHAEGTAWAASHGQIVDFQDVSLREILLTDIYRKWPKTSEYLDNTGANTIRIARIPVPAQGNQDSHLSIRYNTNERPVWYFHSTPLPYTVTTWVLKQ